MSLRSKMCGQDNGGRGGGPVRGGGDGLLSAVGSFCNCKTRPREREEPPIKAGQQRATLWGRNYENHGGAVPSLRREGRRRRPCWPAANRGESCPKSQNCWQSTPCHARAEIDSNRVLTPLILLACPALLAGFALWLAAMLCAVAIVLAFFSGLYR